MDPPRSGVGLGFSGLRVHTTINRDDYLDELIVFHGASYFRSLGRGQVYGLSTRALAIDLGQDAPEEFPRFSQLYLMRPAEAERSIWILATVVSERSRAVFAFYATPGLPTVVDVFAEVRLIGEVGSLGLAPASSMFLFGEEHPAAFGDFRPEVHDSDGMAFLSHDGEWLFRPLRNPKATATSVFRLDSPRGFGLLQRDRAFASYQDLEAHYQDRPSVWVEPLSDWGPGALHLLEIGTQLETDDNIALTWVPDRVPAEGLSLHYRMYFGQSPPGAGPLGAAIATRLADTERGARFVVDFRGPAIVADGKVQAHVDVLGGRILEQHVVHNPIEGGVRLSFEVARDPDHTGDVELRGFLRDGQDVVSETWSYRWQPKT